MAGISSDSGPYNEFNGALTEFDDAYNVYAYAAANGGALDTDAADYLGSATTIGHALDTGTVAGAAPNSGGFVLSAEIRDCAAAPVPGYPGSA